MSYSISMKRSLFFLLLATLIRAETSLPESRHVVAAHYSFNNLSVNDGLSHNLVWDIHQDQYGFMWFATTLGLCRYDGYEFDVYLHDPADSTSLSENQIRTIFQDDAGDLWFAGRALHRYQQQTDSFQRFDVPTDLPYDFINAVFKEGDSFWLATHGAGLFHVKLPDRAAAGNASSLDIVQHFALLPENSSLYRDNVNSIVCDAANNLWVGSSYGLALLTPASNTDRSASLTNRTKNELPTPLAHLENGWIRALYLDSDQVLWIGGQGCVYKYDARSTAPAVCYDVIPDDISPEWRRLINTIQDDQNGQLWIGTLSYLAKLDKATGQVGLVKSNLNDPAKLLYGQMLCFYVDNSGCLWLGSNGYGVYNMDQSGQSVTSFQFDEKDAELVNILGITQDDAGRLWFTSRARNKVYCMNRTENTFRSFQFPVAMYGYQSILADANGHLWLSSGMDVVQIDPKSASILWQLDASLLPELEANGYMLAWEDADHLWLVDERLQVIKRLNIVTKTIESFPEL